MPLHSPSAEPPLHSASSAEERAPSSIKGDAPRTLPLLRQQKGDAASEARRRGFIHPFEPLALNEGEGQRESQPIIENHRDHSSNTPM